MRYGIRRLMLICLASILMLVITGCQSTDSMTGSADPAATGGAADTGSAIQAPAANEQSAQEKAADQKAANPEGGDASPNQAPAGDMGAVSLLITRDYGTQITHQKTISLQPGWTVLDVLKSTAVVTTKWDGSFVNSIDGLESNSGGLSGKRTDWFYYINGVCCDVGAPDYTLQSGEMAWWDYHAWGTMGLTNPAVIGCYPEPFIHGYRGKIGPTTVMGSADNAGLVMQLQQALKRQGVKDVQTSPLNNDVLQYRPGPVIVLGTWSELKQLPWLDSFNQAYRKNGTSVHFTDDGVELLSDKGNVAQTCGPQTGIIAASGVGLGDAEVLWLVAGTDQDGLQKAVDLLASHPDRIHGFYHAAVNSGTVMRLPIQ